MKTKLLCFSIITILPTIVFGCIYRPGSEYSMVYPERNAAHFYALPYNLNPALTGSQNLDRNTNGRLALNHRYQVTNLNSTYIGYDQHVSSLNGGLGLMATRDYSPESGTTHSTINAMYAYVLPVTSKFFLRTGVQMTIGQKSVDFDFLKNYNQPLPSDRVNYPNFAAGMVGYTNRFFVGVAVHNITQPTHSFYGTEDGIIHRRYTLHGGWELPLNKKENPLTLAPNMILMNQFNHTNIDLGAYLSKGLLVSGMWFRQSYGEFRTSDALMVLLGIQTERFRVGYSFDMLVSTARNRQMASHEITIAYNVFKHKDEGNARTSRVPYPAF